jgi:hypothetical protein
MLIGYAPVGILQNLQSTFLIVHFLLLVQRKKNEKNGMGIVNVGPTSIRTHVDGGKLLITAIGLM